MEKQFSKNLAAAFAAGGPGAFFGLGMYGGGCAVGNRFSSKITRHQTCIASAAEAGH